MPIVNDLLTGDSGDGLRVFLNLNWHATEICMRCKHILRFRDLLIRATRSLGSSKKFIPSMPPRAKISGMPGTPNSLAYQNQSLTCSKALKPS